MYVLGELLLGVDFRCVAGITPFLDSTMGAIVTPKIEGIVGILQLLIFTVRYCPAKYFWICCTHVYSIASIREFCILLYRSGTMVRTHMHVKDLMTRRQFFFTHQEARIVQFIIIERHYPYGLTIITHMNSEDFLRPKVDDFAQMGD